MNDQRSPSGHIPLNEPTLAAMPKAEREFWESFLAKVNDAISDELEKDTPLPYEFTPELFAEFKQAVTVYHGDQYCQINQIREMFNCDAQC